MIAGTTSSTNLGLLTTMFPAAPAGAAAEGASGQEFLAIIGAMFGPPCEEGAATLPVSDENGVEPAETPAEPYLSSLAALFSTASAPSTPPAQVTALLGLNASAVPAVASDTAEAPAAAPVTLPSALETPAATVPYIDELPMDITEQAEGESEVPADPEKAPPTTAPGASVAPLPVQASPAVFTAPAPAVKSKEAAGDTDSSVRPGVPAASTTDVPNRPAPPTPQAPKSHDTTPATAQPHGTQQQSTDAVSLAARPEMDPTRTQIAFTATLTPRDVAQSEPTSSPAEPKAKSKASFSTESLTTTAAAAPNESEPTETPAPPKAGAAADRPADKQNNAPARAKSEPPAEEIVHPRVPAPPQTGATYTPPERVATAATVEPRSAAPQTEAPSRAAQPDIERPAPAAPTLQNFRLKIGNDPARAVDLHVAQRAGSVQVSVHSSDPGLTVSLRDDLPSLVNNVQRTGYDMEHAIPAEKTAAPALAHEITSEPTQQGPGTGDQRNRDHQQGQEPRPQRRKTPRDAEKFRFPTIQEIAQ